MARNKREYRGSKRAESRLDLGRGRSGTRSGTLGKKDSRSSRAVTRKDSRKASGGGLFSSNKRKSPVKATSSKRRSGFSFGGSGRFDWVRFRLGAVAVVFALLWVALWGRAYYVQIVEGPKLAAMAQRQHRTTEFVVGERGQIVDNKGKLLAKSVAINSIFANPARVPNPSAAAAKLAGILDMDAGRVRKLLTSKSPHVWIARQIGDAPAAAIREADIAGVHITTEYARQYPNKHLAGRLLGFVGLDDKGLEGLEAAFDDRLAGKQAHLTVERDATGRKLYYDEMGKQVDIRGKDVRLTLDVNVQYNAEVALESVVKKYQAKWGGCLVVRVADGNVLAWAEYPFFNPNSYNDYSPEQWRNRIALDPIEPGSVAKPLLVAAAMQEGVVAHDTIFYCEKGRWRLDGKVIKDISAKDWLPVSNILRFSSNIGAAKIALALTKNKYYDYLVRLGFGQRIGLPLAGESTGILRPGNTWEEFELATAGFGQGFSTTLPQLAKAYLCLANEGVMKPLRLVADPYEATQAETRVFDPRIATEVLRMMEGVVDEGTGHRAQLPGLTVAGKTSTAQKASAKGGYGSEVVASFMGLVPALKPEYLIMVTVDEPKKQHYGGVIAAPAFKEVALKTLAYLGELPDKPVVAAALEDVTSEASVRFCSSSEMRGKVDRSCVIPGDAVPDVRGLSIRKAMEILAGKGVVPSLKGNGNVVAKQTPPPGKPWPASAKQCTIWLQDNAERS